MTPPHAADHRDPPPRMVVDPREAAWRLRTVASPAQLPSEHPHAVRSDGTVDLDLLVVPAGPGAQLPEVTITETVSVPARS